MDSLFTFLFKYRPVAFDEGTVHFSPTAVTWVAALVFAAAAALAVLHYRRHPALGSGRHRWALAAIRLATLALVLVCLLRPTLIVNAAVPQQNFLAILLDDSSSMQLADEAGRARGEAAREQFGPETGAIAKRLAERFQIRTFRFATSTARLRHESELAFAGTQTRLADAMTTARDELSGLPLAGVVLVSDGGDTSEGGLEQALLGARAAGVPVWTVGVGQETLERDIQVQPVSLPRQVLRGTALVVEVGVRHQGYAGERVAVQAEDAGRLLAAEDVTLPPDGQPLTVRLRLTLDDPGPRTIRFRVPPRADEPVAQNNERDAFVSVDDGRRRILYVEGEPRFEVRFLRAAVAADRNLQVVLLQRTADNKYLRLAVDDPEELAGGFPREREDLFGYDGLILGSMEASAFTGDQLQMMADFVDRRGGGLLALGGRRAFSEGDYAGTPLADVLPVELSGAAQDPEAAAAMRLTVRPTRAGALHPVLQLAGDEAASAARWRELPQLSSVNRITALKSGATSLLSGTPDGGAEQIVLAWQRFGRGKALALGAQDTWLWQMHASIGVDDLTHETLWRQWLRWLVDGVPEQVTLTLSPEQPEPGQPVTFSADVVDETYVATNSARLLVTIVAPDGTEEQVAAPWTGGRDGEYQGTFVPRVRGVYEVALDASRGETPLASATAHVAVEPSASEYFDPGMNRGLLERVASGTGGRFYDLSGSAALVEDIKYTSRGVTVVEEHDLWDMPLVLALLLALLGGEWIYRRRLGLA
jgi:uncharacterized membrane protein